MGRRYEASKSGVLSTTLHYFLLVPIREYKDFVYTQLVFIYVCTYVYMFLYIHISVLRGSFKIVLKHKLRLYEVP